MEKSVNQNDTQATEKTPKLTKENKDQTPKTLKILAMVLSYAGQIGCVLEVLAMIIRIYLINDDTDLWLLYHDQIPMIAISMLVTAVIYLIAGLTLSAILKAFYCIITDLDAIKDSIVEGTETNEEVEILSSDNSGNISSCGMFSKE